LVDFALVSAEAVDNEAIAGAQGHRGGSVAAAEVDDQAALDSGGIEDLRGGVGWCGGAGKAKDGDEQKWCSGHGDREW